MSRACTVCGDARSVDFVRRANVPVHQNLLCPTAEIARAVTRGSLEMRVCQRCGFVYNAAFDGAKLSYGRDYENSQGASPTFDAYLDELVGHVLSGTGVRSLRVLEVGCGKGTFLRRLIAHAGPQVTGIGFDPSYEGPASDLDGRLRFERRNFDVDCANHDADVILCRHVIEHVAEPLQLLEAVRRASIGSRQPRVFFETPCVQWILKNRVIWDFFYEHCSLFSAESLQLAFETAGFGVQRVAHVFGGQYLWLEAVPADVKQQCRLSAAGLPELARAYAGQEAQSLRLWHEDFHRMSRAGGVALWGAGAKGSTLANLMDPEATCIDCVVDINPVKQGKYIPGSAHPIVGPESMRGRAVRNVVLMNPNYRAEITRMLQDAGADVRLVELR